MQPLCVFREILMYTKKIYEKPDECVEPTDGQQQQQLQQQSVSLMLFIVAIASFLPAIDVATAVASPAATNMWAQAQQTKQTTNTAATKTTTTTTTATCNDADTSAMPQTELLSCRLLHSTTKAHSFPAQFIH